jgi:hypothetical protein
VRVAQNYPELQMLTQYAINTNILVSLQSKCEGEAVAQLVKKFPILMEQEG